MRARAKGRRTSDRRAARFGPRVQAFRAGMRSRATDRNGLSVSGQITEASSIGIVSRLVHNCRR